MRHTLRLGLVAAVTLAPALSAQETVCPPPSKFGNKCSFSGMSCMCSWKFENRPYTSARNYFLTEKLWSQMPKVCWSELVQFMCHEKPARGVRMKSGVICSTIVEKALAAARERNKLVLFIGMTGG